MPHPSSPISARRFTQLLQSAPHAPQHFLPASGHTHTFMRARRHAHTVACEHLRLCHYALRRARGWRISGKVGPCAGCRLNHVAARARRHVDDLCAVYYDGSRLASKIMLPLQHSDYSAGQLCNTASALCRYFNLSPLQQRRTAPRHYCQAPVCVGDVRSLSAYVRAI